MTSAYPVMSAISPALNMTQVLTLLAGAYSLLNTTSTLNGTTIPDRPYGENPVGILTYSESGYMSATITATEPELRPANLTFPFLDSQSDADWALIGKHGVAYAGPFHVSDAFPATATHGQVFHGPLIVANVPAWVGTEQRRNYTLYENGTLLKIDSVRDGGFRGVLWWKKVD